MVIDRIKKMTLAEKCGQLVMETFKGKHDIPNEVEDGIINGEIGGFCLMTSNNIDDSRQLKVLAQKIQNLANNSISGLPVFLAIDQEGGQLSPLHKDIVIHPGNMALGAISENAKDYTYKMGQITGQFLKTIGINFNLAPVVDLAAGDGVPIKDNRYYSNNPDRVGELAGAFITGLQEQEVMACVKHFPGQRNVDIDSHFELDVIPYSRDHLFETSLLPFKTAINIGVEAVMTLHAAYSNLDPTLTPATLSKLIVTGILRNLFKFDRLIISDDLMMKPIVDHYGLANAVVKALNAGVDIIVVTKQERGISRIIVDAVKKGFISEDRINESVKRVLIAKQKYTNFNFDSLEKTRQIITSSLFHEIIQDAADQSITLIRNNMQLIPLNLTTESRIVILHPGFNRLVMSDISNYYPQTMKEAFLSYTENVSEYIFGLQPVQAEIDSIADWSYDADYIIFCTYNAYQFTAQLSALDKVREIAGDKSIILVSLRSPEDLNHYPPEITSVIATYGVAPVSIKALAGVIFGEIMPKGHLPIISETKKLQSLVTQVKISE